MRASGDNTRSLLFEPKTTPSILASIPDCFRSILLEAVEKLKKKEKSTLISSNSLANRFILERWGIRPSQRKRYRNLFAQVRKQCRAIFQHYLTRGRVEWTTDNSSYVFGVFKFDEIRGNLILGFVLTPPGSEWKLRFR
ncbi:MAG: hypothetical protein ACFFER_01890 [Candidatus Thorarchaeota archaeon]